MYKSKQMFSKYNRAKGFTLTELLVVIMVATILMSIGAMSLLQSNVGRGLDAGVTIVESTIEQARKLAVARNTNARVFINNDTSDSENYGRQLIVAYNDGGWKAEFRSVKLPSGVFVDTSQRVSTSAAVGTLQTNGSIAFKGNSTQTAAYIEFNQLGLCKYSGSSNPGSSLVLVSGSYDGSTIVNKGDDQAGIVVWRNGSTTVTDDIN